MLLKQIKEIQADSRKSYGWPRVHAELTLGLGVTVNRKRVARIMRQAGIQGLYRRKHRRDPVNTATEDDLVHRVFTWPHGTACGSPTSPNTPPRTARCTARRSLTPTPGA